MLPQWHPPSKRMPSLLRAAPGPRHLPQQLRGVAARGPPCLGDSGGPALWTDPSTGVEYVVGICSSGDAAWVSFSNYFRVDTPWALQFIADAISSVEAD